MNTPEPSIPLVVCENLVKIYQVDELEVVALQGLDLEIGRGEMMAIIGASGSGKSTLLNIIGGLDRPSAGQIRVGKRNLLKAGDKELEDYRLHDVGFVWQQSARNLLPYLTAQENVELPMIAARVRPSHPARRARDLLDAVGLLGHSQHRLDQLSGGQQQRVAIAVALANQPQLLLADEPTGEVDSVTAQQIWQLFRTLSQRFHLTCIIVSHDRDIAHVVDRVISIRDGKTSTETVRQAPVANAAMTEISTQQTLALPSLEERVVLDAAGRLQMPQEYLEQRGIGRRAVVQLVEGGILVRQAQERNLPQGGEDVPTIDQDPIPHQPTTWWRRLWRRRPGVDLRTAVSEKSVVTPWDTSDPRPGTPAQQHHRPQTTTVAAVEVSELQRMYTVGDQSVHALRGIDLAIPAGGFVLFRGRSGSGKTTLLNLIGSLDTPTAGRVALFGQDVNRLSADERALLRQISLGFVFQTFSLIPTLSAQENVEMVLRILGTSAGERHRRAAYCLSLVGLSRWADHRPFEMSGGQQQRLSIARALAHGPRILIADEPTSDLDSETGRQILQLFARLVQEKGITVLMASHDPASDDFATNVYELQDGRIQLQ